jgi:hypothetical protein
MSFAVLALALALLALPGARPGTQATFPDLALTVVPPELGELRQRLGPASEQVRGSWSGKLGAAAVEIVLYTFPLEEWGFREPAGVAVVMVDWLREKEDEKEGFDVDESSEREGRYGFAPALSVVAGPLREEGRVVGRQLVATGLLPAHGYAFRVRTRPEPDEAGKAVLERFLAQGIVYAGPERDPQWTMEELEARWTKDAPAELHEDFRRNLSKKAWVKNAVLRTEHYVILTNASGGKKFAEQMEENYDQIGKLFTLPPGKGCRLMPVFLFKTPDHYYAFCTKRGMTPEAAKRSKGHASSDYYATWYESPTDPTHIHEQTHQLFANRLFLTGGGSWLQEGVAEYVETSRNDRNVIASQVAKGKHLALPEFFQRKSLLWSSSEDRKEGGSEASDLYTQAGLFIEFLRDSKWGKERFPRFLQAMGRTPRSKLDKLRAVFQEVYGAEIEAVDREFQAYCAAR